MPKKTPKKIKEIKEFIKPEIDYKLQKSISYSQTLAYNTCPHQWALSYIKNLQEYKPSIHTVFGTAMHETIQHWLTLLYDHTVKQSNELDLADTLEKNLVKIYSQEKERTKEHFTNPEQLQEFYLDGVEILNYLKRKRSAYFSTKQVHLAGIEVPIVYPLKENIFFKGYLDIVLYDERDEKFTILDIKTSTSGWSTEAKKDDKKIFQLLLYKEFLAKQFNIDVEKIEVKYIIVKRKVPINPEYPAMGRRIQEFIPPSGKIKRGQAISSLNSFIIDAFDEKGNYIDKIYTRKPSKSNCNFCPYKKTEHCDSGF